MLHSNTTLGCLLEAQWARLSDMHTKTRLINEPGSPLTPSGRTALQHERDEISKDYEDTWEEMGKRFGQCTTREFKRQMEVEAIKEEADQNRTITRDQITTVMHAELERLKKLIDKLTVALSEVVIKQESPTLLRLLADADALMKSQAEVARLRGLLVEVERMGWRVYPGSEKVDLGSKNVACLCESREQAKHMAKFWGDYGYYERID